MLRKVEGKMTEYQFHWWAPGGSPTLTPSVRLPAESPRHGAALALRMFVQQGCDCGARLAHLDLTAADGARHTLLVDEVVEWLNEPGQAAFVEREGLAVLRQSDGLRIASRPQTANRSSR